MDARITGEMIRRLRVEKGLTQSQLAQKLNISDKTVSRWENGLGFPEVVQFPNLAAVLGVTVDYLMTGQRTGITVAGNIITDIVKTIATFPKVGMLTDISSVTRAVGGCATNTAIDLAKIDDTLKINVLGKIGEDEYGDFIISQLIRYGIDCDKIVVDKNLPTSFCDVMSQPSGERTFFHARGANSAFSPADIDISALNSVMLHIGYILLLDEFDKPDETYGTVMARFLHSVQEYGIKTSVDVVSNSSTDYKEKIIPALKYTDYAILNELESTMLTDLPAHKKNGMPHIDNIKATMEFMADCGVREKIIVHCKEAGFCLDVKSGSFTCVPSLEIPKQLIKGSVGAGDAFCAGSLYGIYNGYDDKRILEFASAAAACSLFSENSVDGMLPKNEIEKIEKQFARKNIKGE